MNYYKIVFPFDLEEVIRCKSLKGFKPIMFTYLKNHKGDVITVYRGKKIYCKYAYDGNNDVMYRLGGEKS